MWNFRLASMILSMSLQPGALSFSRWSRCLLALLFRLTGFFGVELFDAASPLQAYHPAFRCDRTKELVLRWDGVCGYV